MSLSIDPNPPQADAAPGLRADVERAWPGLRADVERAWQGLRARAREEGRSCMLALRVRVPEADPLAFFLAAPAEDRFFWSLPAAGTERACVGRAWTFEIDGGASAHAEPGAEAAEAAEAEADRFGRAARAVGDLLERLEVVGDPAPSEAGPVIHAGFAFADTIATAARVPATPTDRGPWRAFPDALLILAERQVVRLGADCFVTCVVAVPPDAAPDGWQALFEPMAGRADATGPGAEGATSPSDPTETTDTGPEYTVRADRSHARYEASVRDALDAIGRRDLQKVVLARSLEVHHPGRFELGAFLERLTVAYPTCATFAVGRGDSVFVAASPERLVTLEGGVARTAALAGTAPRGRTPESDDRLGRELLASAKNRAEHAAVVDSIVEVLGRHGRVVRADATPRVLKLEGIQHLETPIAAELDATCDLGRPGEAILNLVGELHPTPAVGGRPARAAREWIARHEGLDRGWYAAPVGVITPTGEGEFRVALRSALLSETTEAGRRHAHARLFAGAGIVAGSNPTDELVETRIKLRALLAPLTEI